MVQLDKKRERKKRSVNTREENGNNEEIADTVVLRSCLLFLNILFFFLNLKWMRYICVWVREWEFSKGELKLCMDVYPIAISSPSANFPQRMRFFFCSSHSRQPFALKHSLLYFWITFLECGALKEIVYCISSLR